MSNCLFTELQALMGHPLQAHDKGRSRRDFIHPEIGAWGRCTNQAHGF